MPSATDKHVFDVDKARQQGVLIWKDGTNNVTWICVDSGKRPIIEALEQELHFHPKVYPLSHCMDAREFCVLNRIPINYDSSEKIGKKGKRSRNETN